MRTIPHKFKAIAFVAFFATHPLASTIAFAAETPPATEQTSRLLSTHFESRNVVKIEAGDFHFVPGQAAPVHTHAAPAVGYVAKGSIIYQIEGEKPLMLNEGDAFYEPVGPRILRFDNASATEEAIFIDINLQQQDDPFIVFEKTPTENIDRRTLPTTEFGNRTVSRVETYVSELEPKAKKTLTADTSIVAYVAEGVVFLKTKKGPKKRLVAGQTFSLTKRNEQVTVVNSSSEVPARVVSFYIN